jgi:hypothetical protein
VSFLLSSEILLSSLRVPQYDKELVQEQTRRKEKEAAQTPSSSGQKVEPKDVTVTEIVDAGLFYVQFTSEAAQLDELMKSLKAENLESAAAHSPAVKEIVAAQFTEDNVWYRAEIMKALPDGKYLVFYIDYGNVRVVDYFFPSSLSLSLLIDFCCVLFSSTVGDLGWQAHSSVAEEVPGVAGTGIAGLVGIH